MSAEHPAAAFMRTLRNLSMGFAERPADCYLTPPVVLAFLEDLLGGPVGCDPFHDPRALLEAEHVIDVREGGDGYVDEWLGDSALVNGPYSGKNPARTAARCRAVWEERAREGRPMRVLNLCPAAPGSAYWRADVWGTATSVAWLGRLSFVAGRDIIPKGPGRVIKAGELVHGNRTEIALLDYATEAESFHFVELAHSYGWAAQYLGHSLEELVEKQRFEERLCRQKQSCS
jgi:hypothetical protein